MIDDDLKRGLLGKKGSNFDKLYEECVVKIQRIKQKNDFMQKQAGTDIEQSIREEVKKQKEFIEKEIKQLKDVMNQMEGRFKDPQSKNRLKQLKNDAQKQIERNKIILRDLIQKSFIGKSGGNHRDDDTGSYMESGKVNYGHLENDQDRQIHEKKQSVLTDQQEEIDFDLQRKIQLEKSALLNEVEQATVRINDMFNDMGIMVEEQGENLDVISDQLMKANQNLVVVNKNMEEANTLQKKSRKKYMIFFLIIVLAVAAVAGIVLIFI